MIRIVQKMGSNSNRKIKKERHRSKRKLKAKASRIKKQQEATNKAQHIIHYIVKTIEHFFS